MTCSRVGAVKTIRDKKYKCQFASGKKIWKILPKNSTQGSLTSNDEVFRTLYADARNTSFQISLQEFPEIGQSFQISSPISFNTVGLSVYGANIVDPEFFNVPFSQKSQFERAAFWFESFDAKVVVSIWRNVASSPIADQFDLANGFELMKKEDVLVKLGPSSTYFGGSKSAPFNVELKLNSDVSLVSGEYVIILSFQWDDIRYLTIRFWGQESGSNTVGGKGGGMAKNCTYTQTPDAYPAGRAYAGLGISRWNGDPRSSIGFGQKFKLATAKVSSCIVMGEWGNDIFNPGDLDLVLLRKG